MIPTKVHENDKNTSKILIFLFYFYFYLNILNQFQTNTKDYTFEKTQNRLDFNLLKNVMFVFRNLRIRFKKKEVTEINPYNITHSFGDSMYNICDNMITEKKRRQKREKSECSLLNPMTKTCARFLRNVTYSFHCVILFF